MVNSLPRYCHLLYITGYKSAQIHFPLPVPQCCRQHLHELNKGLVEKADAWAEERRTLFESFIARRLTQRQIRDELSKAKISARRGGEWSLAQVQHTLKRLRLKTQATK